MKAMPLKCSKKLAMRNLSDFIALQHPNSLSFYRNHTDSRREIDNMLYSDGGQ